jgi:hypothetical protein
LGAGNGGDKDWLLAGRSAQGNKSDQHFIAASRLYAPAASRSQARQELALAVPDPAPAPKALGNRKREALS